MLRKVKTLPHSHTANEWQSWDSDVGLFSSKPDTHQTKGSEGPCSQASMYRLHLLMFHKI